MIFTRLSRALFHPVVPFLYSGAHTLGTGTTEGARARLTKSLASGSYRGYGSHVAANSATRLGGLNCPRRYSAHLRIAGAFFVPAITFYGGLRGSTSVCAGSLGRRSANPAQPTTQSCLAAVGGGSYVQGATPMKHALIPSKIRALAHRRMAMSALRANSSLSVRLKRYNHHMDQARSLEAQGGAQ